MYSFHFYGHYFLTMAIIYHLSYLISSVAIHQSKCQPMDHFNITHKEQHQHRFRRFITFFDNRKDDKHDKHYQSGNNSPMVVNDGEVPATATSKDVLETLGEQTNRVLQGATDVVLTPVTWLSHITRYWPLYLICLTIIVCLIAFLHCSCQGKMGNLFSNQKHDPFALLNFFQQLKHQHASPSGN